MSKKIFIFITFVLGIVLVVILVFSYFFKPTGNTDTSLTGTNFISEFFPFGKNKNITEPGTPADISGYTPPSNSASGVNKEKLVRVSSMPIAGYGVFMKERYKEVSLPAQSTTTESPAIIPTPEAEATSPSSNSSEGKKSEEKKAPLPLPPQTEFVPNLRYVERATGNIYQTFADSINEKKFTTTLIPQIYEAYLGNDGNSVVMRYLKDDSIIETFVGNLQKEVLGGDVSEASEITGSFLPENITNMSISPDKSSVFYLFNSGDYSVGVTSNVDGSKKNQVFSSSFTEWLSGWPNDRLITLNTKPSYTVDGYLYALDPNTKRMSKILGGIRGLTSLASPSGKSILFGNNELSLYIYDVDSGEQRPLGIKTLPEKCVWNKSSTTLYCAVPKSFTGKNYPDTWYQGEVSFSDELWKISVETGSSARIADPIEFKEGENSDIINLSLDEDESFLFFMNKKDSYLWELSIK